MPDRGSCAIQGSRTDTGTDQRGLSRAVAGRSVKRLGTRDDKAAEFVQAISLLPLPPVLPPRYFSRLVWGGHFMHIKRIW